jgi:enolase
MTGFEISRVRGWEVLDSRGNPTVAVRVELSGGVSGEAMVPSGASTGTHEAVELRDGDPGRYSGKGTRQAAQNVEQVLGPAVEGMDAREQSALDEAMCRLDGTPGKSRLGANAILGISCAAARAAAVAGNTPLWQHLAGARRATMPVPMINILSGGLHAGKNIEFQDFLAIPHGFERYSDALHAAVAVHKATRQILVDRGCVLTGVADEGGWGPLLDSNEAALHVLTQAIETAGFQPGSQVSIALDVASSHFYQDGRYHLRTEDRVLDASGMIGTLAEWRRRYPVISIEDALVEDDWTGWQALTAELGATTQLVGDDFFTTNPARVERGIRERSANAVLVKMNQIGTLTETFRVVDMARSAGFRAVISARSGETEDSFLADLAVASGMGQIKVGSITRSERLAKYNRLLRLENETDLPFPGSALFADLL